MVLIRSRLASAILAASLVSPAQASLSDGRPYSVSYDAQGFRIDGQYRLLRGGSVQWFRIPEAAWRDRLEKFKAAGFNTIDLYVPWNVVEPEPGRFNFSQPNLGRFLDLAKSLGLYVYLRPGPYITNEMDGGGVPGWLMTQSTKKSLSRDGRVNFRTEDPDFLYYVRRYFSQLNRYVRPWLATSGGPIILYGVENEYNWFATFHELDKLFWHEGGPERDLRARANPAAYIKALRDQLRADGITLPVTTCPGDGKASWTGDVPDVIPMPNIYNGLGGEYPEKVVTELLNDMHSGNHGGRYRNMPSGTTETDRDPARIKRMLLAGLDGTFAFNAVGAIQSGYRNSLVLNGNGSDKFQRIFDFSSIENILTGFVSPTVAYFHNVIDYGGPISPSGLLRPSYAEFHADNLFFDTVEPWLAPAGTAQRVKLPATSGPVRLNQTGLGTREGGNTPWLYWMQGTGGARFVTLLNETSTSQTLPVGGLVVDNRALPRYQALTLPAAGTAAGQFGTAQTTPVAVVPVNLPLPDTGRLTYTTHRLVWSDASNGTRYLILTGDNGETALDELQDARITYQDSGIRIHEKTDTSLTFTTSGSGHHQLVLETRSGRLHILVVPAREAGKVWPVRRGGALSVIVGPDYVSPDADTLWQTRTGDAVLVLGTPPASPGLSPWQVNGGINAGTWLPTESVRAGGTSDWQPGNPTVRRTRLPVPDASQATVSWWGEPRTMESLGQWTGAGWYVAEFDINSTWGLLPWEPSDLYIGHASDIVSLYVNGHYLTTVAPVGTELDSDSANSAYRLPDIRPYLKKGHNTLAIRTEIWGHGSFMWPRGTLSGTAARIPSLGFDSVKGLWGEARLGWITLDNWRFVPDSAPQTPEALRNPGTAFVPGEVRTLSWNLPPVRNTDRRYAPMALRLKGRNLMGEIWLDGTLIGRWLSDEGWLKRGFWGRGQRDMWMNTPPDDFPLTVEALADGRGHRLQVILRDVSAPGEAARLDSVSWVAVQE